MGELYVVGIGPGVADEMTLRAAETLRHAEVIAGYQGYIDLSPGNKIDYRLLVKWFQLEQQDKDRQVTCVLIHLATTTLTLALQLLEIGNHKSEQLDNNGSRDVRHDSQRKDGCIGKGASGEHIQQ